MARCRVPALQPARLRHRDHQPGLHQRAVHPHAAVRHGAGHPADSGRAQVERLHPGPHRSGAGPGRPGLDEEVFLRRPAARGGGCAEDDFQGRHPTEGGRQGLASLLAGAGAGLRAGVCPGGGHPLRPHRFCERLRRLGTGGQPQLRPPLRLRHRLLGRLRHLAGRLGQQQQVRPVGWGAGRLADGQLRSGPRPVAGGDDGRLFHRPAAGPHRVGICWHRPGAVPVAGKPLRAGLRDSGLGHFPAALGLPPLLHRRLCRDEAGARSTYRRGKAKSSATSSSIPG